MLSYILGIITGILLSIVAIVSKSFSDPIKSVKDKLNNNKAYIVETENILDKIDLT